MQGAWVWSLVRELTSMCLAAQQKQTKQHNSKTRVCQCTSHPVVWPRGLQPPGLLRPWDSPGKNAGAGCHFLLQGSSPPRDRARVSWAAGGFSTLSHQLKSGRGCPTLWCPNRAPNSFLPSEAWGGPAPAPPVSTLGSRPAEGASLCWGHPFPGPWSQRTPSFYSPPAVLPSRTRALLRPPLADTCAPPSSPHGHAHWPGVHSHSLPLRGGSTGQDVFLRRN